METTKTETVCGAGNFMDMEEHPQLICDCMMMATHNFGESDGDPM